jgi:FkbM family methyltransferase
MIARLRYLVRELGTYAREARTPRDFIDLMRVRLSMSKVGWLVCRRPMVVEADLHSFGGPVRLRSHTTDVSVLSELVVCGAYDAVADRADLGVRTVLDLGANVGLTARWMAARWPGSRIVCVEPEAGNAAVLRHNVAALEGVTVVEACVGAFERTVELTTTTGEHGFSMSCWPGNGVSSEVVTMDQVLIAGDIETIDLLKCDIEGAERELFSDCRTWIGRVDLAVVECHDGFTAEDLLDLLEENGAAFEIAEREIDPDYGLDTVTLCRTASQ